MTSPTPVVQGQPDFQTFTQTSKIIIINKTQSFTGQTLFGPIYAGNMPFMNVRLAATVSMRVTIQWFADAAGTFQILDDTIVNAIPGLGTANVPIPVRAPYCRFVVDLSAYPNTATLQAIATPSKHNLRTTADGENTLFVADNFTIAGGGNATFSAQVTRAGLATWVADGLGATNFVAYLMSTNFLGVTTKIDYVNTTNRGQRRQVYLPALPIKVQAFNLDGVNHDFNISVCIHPFDF